MVMVVIPAMETTMVARAAPAAMMSKAAVRTREYARRRHKRQCHNQHFLHVHDYLVFLFIPDNIVRQSSKGILTAPSDNRTEKTTKFYRILPAASTFLMQKFDIMSP